MLSSLNTGRGLARSLARDDRALFVELLERPDVQRRLAAAKDAAVEAAAAMREQARRELYSATPRPRRNKSRGQLPTSGVPAPRGEYANRASWGVRLLERNVLRTGSRGIREALAEVTKVAARKRALSWVAGLDTRSGTPRVVRIALCGQAIARARVGGDGRVEYSWSPLWCRDRACPACAQQRSTQLQRLLRAHYDARVADGAGRMLFVTLTQPKRVAHREGPAAALDRLGDAWKRWRRSRLVRRLVAGGAKAIECKWSAGKGRFAGWHAHIHLALELQPGAPDDAHEQLFAVWIACTQAAGDRAERSAQDVQDIGRPHDVVKYITKVAQYITKPFELPDARAVQYFRQTAGRRLIDGWGTWRRFRRALPPPECKGWMYGPPLQQLAAASRDDRPVLFEHGLSTRGKLPAVLERCDPARLPPDMARLRRQLEPMDSRHEHRGLVMHPAMLVSPRDVWQQLRADPRPAYARDRPPPEPVVRSAHAEKPSDIHRVRACADGA